MILLIDVGNTRVKWGWLEGKTVCYGGAFFYKNKSVVEEFVSSWQVLPIQRVVVSNVGGKIIGEALTAWFVENKKVTPEFRFAESEMLGFRLGYTQPKSCGMDRFFAMLACWHTYGDAFVLMGCGSATTFDVVQATGQHLGSLIAPGLYLQHTAMAQLANCAMATELAVAKQDFGHSTAEAISQGTLQLISGFFNYQIQLLTAHNMKPAHCVITGGDAECILPFMSVPCDYRPHVVLEGLAIALRRKAM